MKAFLFVSVYKFRARRTYGALFLGALSILCKGSSIPRLFLDIFPVLVHTVH